MHLGRGLEVEIRPLEAHPVLRVEVAPRADAQQHVVRLVLLLVHVVQVVGDDQRQAGLRGEAEQLLVEAALLGDPVVLEFQEEPVLAEDVAVLRGERAGQLPVVHLEGLGDLATEAGRHADQSLAVLGEVLSVDAGLVVVAVDVGVGDQPAQVLVAGHVGRQQEEVEGLAVGLALLVRHRPPGDVGLHADDRLDARLGGRLVERDRAVERAVVGDGEAVEPVLDARVDEVRDPPQPVEQAELRVGVEVDEVVRGDGHGTSMVAEDRLAPVAGRSHSGRCSRDVNGSPVGRSSETLGRVPRSTSADFAEHDPAVASSAATPSGPRASSRPNPPSVESASSATLARPSFGGSWCLSANGRPPRGNIGEADDADSFTLPASVRAGPPDPLAAPRRRPRGRSTRHGRGRGSAPPSRRQELPDQIAPGSRPTWIRRSRRPRR